jgi:hypothetical protein
VPNVTIMNQRTGRIGAILAIGGSVLLLIGTALHPMDADPGDAVAAFTEYAADPLWVASHLVQLAGIALMVAALLLLSQQLEAGGARVWPRLAAGTATAALAVSAALQAVDGIALKVMVDAWAAAPSAQKETAFYAAFAVRQVEVGLASMVSMLFGMAAALYGMALLGYRRYPKWLAALAFAGGLPTMAAGGVIAYTGFSDYAMTINMPANMLLLAWMLLLGWRMWRDGTV